MPRHLACGLDESETECTGSCWADFDDSDGMSSADEMLGDAIRFESRYGE